MYDLSILIPARNEQFLKNTIDDALSKIRGNTEIIVVLDGAWADPPLESNDRLTIIYNNTSIGQRAATNQACRLSGAKYVMKVDAHCSFDEGFDIKMMSEMKDDYTMTPVMYNHHAFDWVCKLCGSRKYQGPTPLSCWNGNCIGQVEREMVWKPRLSRRSTAFRFDKTLHFQYWGDYKARQVGEICDTFSIQGSCFMVTRAKYWELDLCDEKFGSWGQQGVEVACKTWLSGGRVVVNKKTWYSHLFRTQGGDFGFPYPQSQKKIDYARQYSRELFIGDKWPKAIYPFSWLIEKFKPIPDWHEFQGVKVQNQPQNLKPYNKGIVFFTDNQLNLKIAHVVQKQLIKIEIPIVSASLKPMTHFGDNVYLKLQRGYLTMFKQVLAGLEMSKAEIVFLCEHDVIYHPSHFDFTPPKKDVFYYNVNWWKIRFEDNYAVSWEASQVSGLCAYRELLLEHYRKRVSIVEKYGYNHSMGFEPGSHNYKETIGTRNKDLIPKDIYIDDVLKEEWKSKYPYIDIRYGANRNNKKPGSNLSYSKWSLEDFRDKTTARNWTTGSLSSIKGWDFSRGLLNPIALI